MPTAGFVHLIATDERKALMYSQHAALLDSEAPFNDEEIAAIRASMPLVACYAALCRGQVFQTVSVSFRPA